MLDHGISTHLSEPIARVTSEEDRRRVREHLKIVLADPLFSNSKRLPAFLRHVVSEALEGVDDSQVKERTLGVTVFGRAPDYDTNADPVVRVTAGEVRKKLAQYYYARPETDVQIEVPLGSYLPRFRFATETPEHVPEIAAVAAPEHVPEAPEHIPVVLPAVTSGHGPSVWWAVGLGALLLAGISMLAWRAIYAERPTEGFWNAFSSSSKQVLIVLPALSRVPQALPLYHFEAESVAIEDAEVAARLSNEFHERNMNSHLVLATGVSLTNLRGGPFVLIGAMDNVWTMRLSQSLPFAFERSDDRRYGRIVDRKNANLAWMEDFSVPNAQIPVDYGIVARFTDATTEQPTLLIAGISAEGTLAAGEAVTNPRYLAALLKAAGHPPGGFEAVIQTKVIDGQSGPPEIVAMRTW